METNKYILPNMYNEIENNLQIFNTFKNFIYFQGVQGSYPFSIMNGNYNNNNYENIAMFPQIEKMLEDYGQSILIPVKKGEKPNGYFKYYKYETSSILNGKEADWYKIYKGSSEFDSKEMTILIDGIIQEYCNDSDIVEAAHYNINFMYM